jgi:hypothetical protein
MKNRSIIFTAILSVLAYFALGPAPKTFGVVPPPDGGYPGFNTAEGDNALKNLNTAAGIGNTAVGALSLFSDVEGSFNTAIGGGALALSTGGSNTGIGAAALILNTTGERNTAVGTAAMVNNATGIDNTAVGDHALTGNTTGDFNTAIGVEALVSNMTGTQNTAVGEEALLSNTEGNFNTAIGNNALIKSTGSGNTALGFDAGANLTDGDNNIHIGNEGLATDDGLIRIGDIIQTRTFIAGISGVNQGSPAAVFINTTTGQLGTTPPASSRRYKKEIRPMEQTSEAILGLKPVTFHYKSDNTGTPQFGLIAEEVAEVNPDLVVRDESGEIYSVRYDQVNAMLLNEFLKEHKKVQELEATVTQQHKNFERQQKQIDSLTSNLQRVSAQLEMNKATRTMALNDQ